MSYGEVEHFAAMVAGCESFNTGDVQAPDARYALSVLKLHANDMGLVAGQEGFLDSIKKGAQTIKQWFLSLVRAIKDFLQGSKTAVQAKELAKAESEHDKWLKERGKTTEDLNTKKAIIVKETFEEPVRLAVALEKEINEVDDRKGFEGNNLNKMHISLGRGVANDIFHLLDVPVDRFHYVTDFKEVLDKINDLNKAIGALAQHAYREVSTWEDETTQEEERKSINKASYLLKSYTQMYKWLDGAASSSMKKISDLIQQQ